MAGIRVALGHPTLPHTPPPFLPFSSPGPNPQTLQGREATPRPGASSSPQERVLSSKRGWDSPTTNSNHHVMALLEHARPLPTPGLCPHGCPSPYPGSLPGVAPWGRGSRTWPRSGGVGTAEAPEGQWSCGRAHRASRPGTVRERLCRKWAPGHRSVWWPRIRHGPGRATGPAGLRSTLHAGR